MFCAIPELREPLGLEPMIEHITSFFEAVAYAADLFGLSLLTLGFARGAVVADGTELSSTLGNMPIASPWFRSCPYIPQAAALP
jgi:hypothetical protein